MNKNSVNNVVEFMVKVLIVFGIVIGVIIFTLIILFMKEIIGYHKRGEEKIQIITDEYPAAIENHLESKYGEKFIINPKWIRTGGGSPIPFSEDGSPIYYEAYAKNDSKFIFRIYVDSISEKDHSIKEIRDGYCWKYLREQVRAYFEKRIVGVINQDYKLVVDVNPDITFDNNVNLNSPTESYFKYANRKASICIYLILNENTKISEKEILRDKLYKVLKEYYNKFDKNMYIELECFAAKTQDDFIKLDDKNNENKIFVTVKSVSTSNYDPWGVNLETIFTIDVIND
ncbi:DUF5037 domain-containing protein [Clostridium sp. E02]|uniref:DUF5037 domain-containing protein n=1 Tax=Clostridium sp. E02 TaxID=2487134 RepID=UPI000F531C20|nr:DUF5037 domain-containing protein [Clostridium sp. E02]